MSPFVSIGLSLLSAILGIVLKHLYPNIPVPLPGGSPVPIQAPTPTPSAPASHPILDALTKAIEQKKLEFEKAVEQALANAVLSNLPNLNAPAAPKAS